MADELQLEIRKIEAGDKLTGLSLGDAQLAPLKTFLQRHARHYQDSGLAVTYGVFEITEENGERVKRIRGYITLVCGEIVTAEPDGRLVEGPRVDFRYNHYPAVKIARLAVDRRMQRGGIGSALVDLAIGQTKSHICPTVGCRFLVVDSKRGSVSFYEKVGFTLLDTEENKAREERVLFIDLLKLSTDSTRTETDLDQH